MRAAQEATEFAVLARNPHGAWHYDYPPTGKQDTSVTGWMLLALRSAESAGLSLDLAGAAACADTLSWLNEVTDQRNGRIGYDAVGSLSSRVPGVNDLFPANRTECMTGVGLWCRFLLGQVPGEGSIMNKHAERLLRSLPRWSDKGLSNDFYYWFHGTHAMLNMGGKYWKAWDEAMERALLGSQRKDGEHSGSWDPTGPWCFWGGRVYSTAMACLCLAAGRSEMEGPLR